MIIVMLGAPGSGKGTASERLKKDLNLMHISTGNMLREQIKMGTELGMKAKEYMDAGELVPDEVIINMVKAVINSKEAANGVLLDGFPRTVPQAEALKEFGVNVDIALNIDVPNEEIVERMGKRRCCDKCGATYSLDFKPPKEEGKCDTVGCSGNIIQRDDDKPETVRARLEVYEKQTKPIAEFYKAQDKLYNAKAGDKAGKNTYQVVDEFEEFISKKS